MLLDQEIKIGEIVVHEVGNELREEELKLSSGPIKLNDDVKDLLMRYFLKPFKAMDYLTFYHESDLGFNEVYAYASRIFEDPAMFFEESMNLARHLYNKASHPNIKSGEFYVVYFEDCQIEGDTVDAVGIFKSENKETYLKVFSSDDNFDIDKEVGININKLDKGCIVYNRDKENGYSVQIVDNVNRGEEARYWKDDFLKVRPRKDNYNQTEKAVEMVTEFVNYLPQEFELSKADQVEVLQSTNDFFKENETFSVEQFTEAVLPDEEATESFHRFKETYLEESELELDQEFRISDMAVKKQQKNFKSVIKLDKNFSLYVHGNQRMLENGYDEEKQLNYYKLYYTEEK